MDTPYYNLIPPLAKSEDFEPLSPGGSDDSGVQEEQIPLSVPQNSKPTRPPRSIDTPSKLPKHSYINLGHPDAPVVNSNNNLTEKTLTMGVQGDPLQRVVNSNCNAGNGNNSELPRTPPPSLPKRQPYLVNPRSPALSTNRSASSASARSSLFRHQQKSRGICKCKTATSELNNTNEEDILLIYSRYCPGAVEWAKYLHKLYLELSKRKGKLRVRHLPVEDFIDSLLPPQMEREISGSRLQLVLLSPTLLQVLARNSNTSVMGRFLHPDRVIAIMLGVRDAQILPEHRTSLVSFAQWIHLEAKDHDLEFVQTVLYFSTQILQRSNKIKKTENSVKLARSASSNNCRPSESTLFHVHPRRVTEDQSRVMIIFETPQSSRASMKITLERNQNGLADVDLDEMKLLNPYCLLVTIPSCCFSICNLASLRLEVDGANRGCRTLRLESNLSEMDHLIKVALDPLEFMCQAVGVNPACKDKLDEALAKQFRNNMPQNGGLHLLKGEINSESTTLSGNDGAKDSAEFPTLLHFAACHGLEKLSNVLMDCLGFNDAIQMRNVSEMTPAELAHVNGHFELANKLHALHVQIYKEWNQMQHVYDYIQQNNYQIPPPPRPVHEKPPKNNENKNPNDDPFGTLKAAKKITEKQPTEKINNVNEDMEVGDDDVFLSNSNIKENDDKFGTLKANKVMNSMRQERLDYRETSNKKSDIGGFGLVGGGNGSTLPNDDLIITDELLTLLEDFQKKNYSAKEMEMLFESWKRKAAITDEEPTNTKTEHHTKMSKKHKATNLILKLFKTQGGNNNMVQHSFSDPAIKSTKNTKTYRKPSIENIVVSKPEPPNPAPGNETIIEGEITIINDADLSLVELPNTPKKPQETSSSNNIVEGISTQILPLSRLSLSSNSSPPNSTTTNSNNNKSDNQTTPTSSSRPVAEVPPFSSESNSENKHEKVEIRAKHSPVRDKLDKIRRSLTEPLIQYFHDLQSSTPDEEESEVLNTPKSVVPPNTNSDITNNTTKPKSRNLFSENSAKDLQTEKPPQIMVTDM